MGYGWIDLRLKVEARDKGVCSECGTDCMQIKRTFRAARMRGDYVQAHGMVEQYPGLDIAKPFWHPVRIDLKAKVSIENSRTMCLACIKKGG